MNYAAAFIVLILGAATIFWYYGGRMYYTGPIIEARAGEGSESERPSLNLDAKPQKEDNAIV